MNLSFFELAALYFWDYLSHYPVSRGTGTSVFDEEYLLIEIDKVSPVENADSVDIEIFEDVFADEDT